MSHNPVECPLCGGSGIVRKVTFLPDWINHEKPEKHNLLNCNIGESKCLNCNGTGLVVDTGRYSPIIQIA